MPPDQEKKNLSDPSTWTVFFSHLQHQQEAHASIRKQLVEPIQEERQGQVCQVWCSPTKSSQESCSCSTIPMVRVTKKICWSAEDGVNDAHLANICFCFPPSLMVSDTADVDHELLETLSAATVGKVSNTSRGVRAGQAAGHGLQRVTAGKCFLFS
jgi:hypothetical protein